MTYDYGNARVAAMRGRLLDRQALAGLAGSGSAEAILAQLERHPDWAPILRQVAPLGGDAGMALDAAIERHRSARTSVLARYYEETPRRLTEALVLPFDEERLLAVLRRRRAGQPPADIAAGVIPGALLDARSLAEVARAGGPAECLRPVVQAGVMAAADAARLVAAELAGKGTVELEALLRDAFDRARQARAEGSGEDARAVREVLARERADRDAVIMQLTDGGPALATLLERARKLARLDALAALGRRDPLGIGTVAGYLAALEAQAVRLRAALARVRAGWSAELVATYMAASERPTWRAWSS